MSEKGSVSRFSNDIQSWRNLKKRNWGFEAGIATTIRATGSAEGTERYVYRLRAERRPNDRDHPKEIYMLLKALKDSAFQSGRTKVTLVIPRAVNPGTIRKMTECILKNAGVKLAIHMKESAGEEEPKEGEWRVVPNKKGKNRTPRDRGRSEAILMKAEGKTAVVLLKEVKETVNIEEAGIVVKGIKETRGGELLVAAGGSSGKEEVDMLKEIIMNRIQEISVKGRTGGDHQIYIRDIDDAVANAEDVVEDVRRSLNEVHAKVKAKRPALGD